MGNERVGGGQPDEAQQVVVAVVDQTANARLVDGRKGAKYFDDVLVGVKIAFKVFIAAKVRNDGLVFFGYVIGKIAQDGVTGVFVFAEFGEQRLNIVNRADYYHTVLIGVLLSVTLNGETEGFLEYE